MSLSQYASEKLWQAYGMERDATWMIDLSGHERGGCCLSMTLGDYARFGQFMLNGGIARGRQSCPPDGSPRRHRHRSPMAHSRQATDISGGWARAAPTMRPAFSANRSTSSPMSAW
jgi:CubicO group peptidase (beta-lactamase class C family)